MKREIDRAVQQPLLDRLTDLEPASGVDPRPGYKESVRQLKAAVQRDLDWLLNTRRMPEPLPEGLEEVGRSVFCYGLPDISSLGRDANDTNATLLRHVEDSLVLYEPRLANVRVTIVETSGDADALSERRLRELRFLVEATLRMDPTPEHVVFDTVLDKTSFEFEVKGANGA